jgi:4a-hydroxytetrahydrobiopterin dehydratase
MSELAKKDCVPCKSGTPALAGAALEELQRQLGGGWTVVDGKRLEKEYKFPNFVDALAFVNRVGEVAEQQGHHPDLELGWGRVKITLWTHSIGGLSEADFVLAAKADQRV